jgi:oligopeptide transport system substrate-binding protein
VPSLRKDIPAGLHSLLLFTAVLGLSVLLVGCSGPGAASAQQAGRSGPRRGGVLRMVEEAPATLDPALTTTVYESFPVNQIFDGLVALDAGLHVVPGLADTWVISKDGLTYTFHLRSGVRFHDGSPLTSDDVLFSIRRVLEPGRKKRSVAFSYLAVVSGAMDFAAGKRPDLPGVDAPDPLTIRIRLDRPYLSFLDVMAMDGLRVVPRRVAERLGDEAFGRAPVGTGPFRLVSWTPQGLRLAANPDYFGGAPYLDGTDILFMGPDETDLGAGRFDRGEVDLYDVSREHMDAAAQDPRARVLRYQELSVSFLGFLTGTPPLDDVRVRQAAAMAIDREALVKQSPLVRRFAVGILPPGMPGYSPDLKALPHDPARARQLLAEAGHPGGRGLRPIVLYNASRSKASLRVQAQIRSDLEAVGIRLDVRDVTWSELTKRTDDHDAPAFVLAWIADLTDPDAFLRTLFQSGNSANYFDFLDAETDALLEAGAREMNPVTRAKIYREAEKHILGMAPLVPLYHTLAVVAVRRTVHGFEPTPLGIASLNLEHVWLAVGDGAS